ncbi:hypothetical protein Droror1_Dr00013110 [Drosera rotundifolia]
MGMGKTIQAIVLVLAKREITQAIGTTGKQSIPNTSNARPGIKCTSYVCWMIRLLSLYRHMYECGCSILSCSFSDDANVYYCVGTAYVLPEENEPTKGRILVFAVEDGKLQLIAEKETKAVEANVPAITTARIYPGVSNVIAA